jgi:hypothetical protein
MNDDVVDIILSEAEALAQIARAEKYADKVVELTKLFVDGSIKGEHYLDALTAMLEAAIKDPTV